MFTQKLLLQNWFGEVQGVRILADFRRAQAPLLRSEPALARELDRQIGDEIRHAGHYRAMMKRLPAPAPPTVAESWRNILGHVVRSHSFSTVVVGVYGLIEPFNLAATQAITLPLLGRADRAEVNEILRDEENHVAMLPLFEELIATGKVRIDRAECLRMVRLFLDEQRGGIWDDEGGSPVRFPPDVRRAFLSHVLALKGKIEQWA